MEGRAQLGAVKGRFPQVINPIAVGLDRNGQRFRRCDPGRGDIDRFTADRDIGRPFGRIRHRLHVYALPVVHNLQLYRNLLWQQCRQLRRGRRVGHGKMVLSPNFDRPELNDADRRVIPRGEQIVLWQRLRLGASGDAAHLCPTHRAVLVKNLQLDVKRVDFLRQIFPQRRVHRPKALLGTQIGVVRIKHPFIIFLRRIAFTVE